VENTLTANSKGGIYECAVADALYKKGYTLYFYKNETTKKELDIILQKAGQIIPVELKAGNARANSMRTIMKKYENITTAYKFINGNIGVSEDGVVTLPLYMAAFI
jgi:predicted AAA+ superfamily ATPase